MNANGGLLLIDLAYNNLKTLPTLPSSLKIMFFLENEFEEIPDCIQYCKQLTMLSFKNNSLQAVAPGLLPLSINW